MNSPLRTCRHAVIGDVRSTTYLSAFVGIFQGVICLHRKVTVKDHKLVYWVAGGIAALSVLLEKKARRGELALYVLPRAVDSYILVNRHMLPNIKNVEVALFSICMGGIMYYLEYINPYACVSICVKPSKLSSSYAPTDTYVQELTTKIRQSLTDEVEEKVTKKVQAEVDEQVNKKVQQNLAWVLKKLGEANPNITVDIEQLGAIISSDNDDDTPMTGGTSF